MGAFEYASPQSIDEAVSILSNRSGARPLAGGQKVLLERNRERPKSGVLVDLGRISSLKGIDRQDGGLRIGATATLNEIASSELIGKQFPVLAEVAGTIGDAQLRNRATIGGNLAEGDPEYDLPALILALRASLEIAGPHGARKVAADDFFQGSGSPLASGELVISVAIPALARNSGMAYVRFKHPARLTAVCGVAALLTADRGRILDAKIAVTGATEHPVRLEAVEKVLLNGPANGDRGASAVDGLGEGIVFRGDAYASAEYRRHLTRVLTGRAIKQALLRTTS